MDIEKKGKRTDKKQTKHDIKKNELVEENNLEEPIEAKPSKKNKQKIKKKREDSDDDDIKIVTDHNNADEIDEEKEHVNIKASKASKKLLKQNKNKKKLEESSDEELNNMGNDMGDETNITSSSKGFKLSAFAMLSIDDDVDDEDKFNSDNDDDNETKVDITYSNKDKKKTENLKNKKKHKSKDIEDKIELNNEFATENKKSKKKKKKNDEDDDFEKELEQLKLELESGMYKSTNKDLAMSKTEENEIDKDAGNEKNKKDIKNKKIIDDKNTIDSINETNLIIDNNEENPDLSSKAKSKKNKKNKLPSVVSAQENQDNLDPEIIVSEESNLKLKKNKKENKKKDDTSKEIIKVNNEKSNADVTNAEFKNSENQAMAKENEKSNSQNKVSDDLKVESDDNKNDEANYDENETSKKNKKKKKGASSATTTAVEEKEDKKKKPSKMVKNILEAQKLLELERLRQIKEEEEKIKKEEEEEQMRIEKERLEKEKKERKKQKEKEKIQRMKAEGKFLTEKQKEDRKRAQQMIEAIKAQGVEVHVPGQATTSTVEKPKKIVYARLNKKKANQNVQTSENNIQTTIDENSPSIENEKSLEEISQKVTIIDQDKTDAVVELMEEDNDDNVKDAWDLSSSEEEETEASNLHLKDNSSEKSLSTNLNINGTTSLKSTDTKDHTTKSNQHKISIENKKDTHNKFIKGELNKLKSANKSTNVPIIMNKHSQNNNTIIRKKIETKEQDDEITSSNDSSSDDSSSDSSSSDESDEGSDDGKTPQQLAREKALLRIQKRKDDAEASKNNDILRAPVVCVLGHVDTGKTKILDKLRRSHVQDGEAGGITQQIGATNVPLEALKEQTKMCKDLVINLPGLLIIDTPGHESFSNLRTRGSSLCDLAILVVDIMHGLEPQTIESINILKQKKTPFVVALNKIDRLYGWITNPGSDVSNLLKKQKPNVKIEFEQRTQAAIVQFAEQGLNACLFYENKNPREYISLVPTSAHTGDGIGNLMALICQLTQSMLVKRLALSEHLQATVMEVKAIAGLGTTIDVILVNGRLQIGQTIIVAGQDGPIVTQIRSLMMPQPMHELRVKGQFEQHKEVVAAQGCKIAAKDLEKALAGLPLYVAYHPDEIEIYREEVAQMLKEVLGAVKVSDKGVYVQASTLGSLEALLVFLKTSEIPYCGINIGPVHKKDIMKASAMLEHEQQYACVLAFDVKIEREAQEMADSLGIRIFHADIIYHLFDKFIAYRDEYKKQKREEFKNIAVFPCKLKILPEHIFNTRDPIVMGVSVEAGFLKEGTLICVPSKEFVDIGRVSSIEINHKQVEKATKGQEVCIKIDAIPGEAPKLYGRHFDHQDALVSKISRQSIDAVKNYFREEMTKADWQLVMELKKTFEII